MSGANNRDLARSGLGRRASAAQARGPSFNERRQQLDEAEFQRGLQMSMIDSASSKIKERLKELNPSLFEKQVDPMANGHCFFSSVAQNYRGAPHDGPNVLRCALVQALVRSVYWQFSSLSKYSMPVRTFSWPVYFIASTYTMNTYASSSSSSSAMEPREIYQVQICPPK